MALVSTIKVQEQNLADYRWKTTVMEGYPKEPALENIWIYYPKTDKSEKVS